MTIWLFLHIASMFGAVSIFVGQGLLSAGIAGSGDVRAIRRSIAAEERFQPLGGALLVLGIVFGVVTALTAKLDLTAPWLLIAYGLVVLVFITGISFHAPRGRKLKELANSSPDDQPSEALRALINAPSARLVVVVDSLIWLGLIYVMVAKPFG
jgi:small-conductance mechanosensitive channel